MENVGNLLVLLAFAGLFAYYATKRSQALRRAEDPVYQDRPPQEAIDDTSTYLAATGWTISNVSDRVVAATRAKRPSWKVLVGCLLAVVPGVGILPLALVLLAILFLPAYLLYFATVRPRISLSVMAQAESGGSRLTVTSDDRASKVDFNEWARYEDEELDT